MKKEVKEQVGEVAVGLKELYTQASTAVGKLDARVEKLESKGGVGHKSLLHYKKHDHQRVGTDGPIRYRRLH